MPSSPALRGWLTQHHLTLNYPHHEIMGYLDCSLPANSMLCNSACMCPTCRDAPAAPPLPVVAAVPAADYTQQMENQTQSVNLLQRTAVALSQLHHLLQQATDILADLHGLHLIHTGHVDPHFHRSFPPLPAPPPFVVPVPSPTSSCDSSPPHPRLPPSPHLPTPDTPTPTPSPSPQPPKKRRAPPPPPPPPLNEQANWDDWDGDAECRLIELKTDSQLITSQLELRGQKSGLLHRTMQGSLARAARPSKATRCCCSLLTYCTTTHSFLTSGNTHSNLTSQHTSPSYSTTDLRARLFSTSSSHTASTSPPADARPTSEDSHPEPPIGSYFV